VSTRDATEGSAPVPNDTDHLTHEVFVNDPPPQDIGLLPNGEPKLFSPVGARNCAHSP
jgi:hypothetical protein